MVAQLSTQKNQGFFGVPFEPTLSNFREVSQALNHYAGNTLSESVMDRLLLRTPGLAEKLADVIRSVKESTESGGITERQAKSVLRMVIEDISTLQASPEIMSRRLLSKTSELLQEKVRLGKDESPSLAETRAPLRSVSRSPSLSEEMSIRGQLDQLKIKDHLSTRELQTLIYKTDNLNELLMDARVTVAAAVDSGKISKDQMSTVLGEAFGYAVRQFPEIRDRKENLFYEMNRLIKGTEPPAQHRKSSATPALGQPVSADASVALASLNETTTNTLSTNVFALLLPLMPSLSPSEQQQVFQNADNAIRTLTNDRELTNKQKTEVACEATRAVSREFRFRQIPPVEFTQHFGEELLAAKARLLHPARLPTAKEIDDIRKRSRQYEWGQIVEKEVAPLTIDVEASKTLTQDLALTKQTTVNLMNRLSEVVFEVKIGLVHRTDAKGEGRRANMNRDITKILEFCEKDYLHLGLAQSPLAIQLRQLKNLLAADVPFNQPNNLALLENSKALLSQFLTKK